MSRTRKPKYTHGLTFLEEGFFKILDSAEELLKASDILIENKIYSQSLSLAVISLEEIGKIFILDSLLFSKTKDSKFKAYKKSTISHRDKLQAAQFFIGFLKGIAKHDKRHEINKAFRDAITIGLLNLHEEYQQVRDSLPNSDIRTLDTCKQKGFYTHYENSAFLNPSDMSDEKLSIAINALANKFLQNARFIMNKNAVSNYLSIASKIRGKLVEDDWMKVELIVEGIFDNLKEELDLD